MRCNNLSASQHRRCAVSELKLVNVIFRHGDRLPLIEEYCPSDPHKNTDYYPYAEGDLTKEGKRQLYKVGTTLRQKYSSFLGRYCHKYVEVISSDTPRTKMGAMLVCAGLYPPSCDERFEENINWQPIPFKYTKYTDDTLLVDPFSRGCPLFIKEYDKILASDYYKNLMDKYRSVLQYVGEKSGIDELSIKGIYYLHFSLYFQRRFNLNLPEWTVGVFPEKIMEIAAQEYVLETMTDSMIQQTAGELLKKIIKDCDETVNEKSEKKIVLYSAHETTLAYNLRALRIFEPHVPPSASYIIFELQKSGENYGIQIFYHDYKAKEPRLMVMPNCEEVCPFERFKELTKYAIPRSLSKDNV